VAGIKSYRDLQVWQKGMQLASLVYRASRVLPKDEQFGLISQMRRAAVSVPSNIAEGYGRRSRADYVRFLNMAMGSLYELQTQSEIAVNIGYFEDAESQPLAANARELERMLSAMIRKLAPLLLCAFVPLCLCASAPLSLCAFVPLSLCPC
jgi:four helix bundle protein